jgi:hypothetical protein
MYHHFQLNPRTILGVGPDATAEQIHEAFREKSKKHHPDLGGDEWAFHMVVRAYEVLKSTANGLEIANGVDAGQDASGSSWAWPVPRVNPFSQGWFPFGSEPGTGEPAAESPAEAATATQAQTEPPEAFQIVDAELIWIRFEMEEGRISESSDGPDRATLSVCMVVSWPVKALVARTAEFAGAGETLRRVIDAFERLDQGSALAVRTRIEDGQFVGWVSFPDVVAAQSAFLGFREALANDGLGVRLQTRDEMIPRSWRV